MTYNLTQWATLGTYTITDYTHTRHYYYYIAPKSPHITDTTHTALCKRQMKMIHNFKKTSLH